MSLPMRIEGNRVCLGDWFAVSFERTLRVPDDGRDSPLPPGLGDFPIAAVEEFGDRLPADWCDEGGVLIPMYPREAMWIRFLGPHWHPCALKVGVGGVDAITGSPWDEAIHDGPQDYLVCPYQPWLDGFKTGGDVIRQFVAVPLGRGDTVEAQLSGRESTESIRLVVYEPRPGIFPDRPPPQPEARGRGIQSAPAAAGSMGLGAGGTIRQKVYPDPHGIGTWDPARSGGFVARILDSRLFADLTGRIPPPTPIDAETYAHYHLPWFDLDDAARSDVAASEALAGVRSVRQRDALRGEAPQPGDQSVPIDPSSVKTLRPPGPPPLSGS